MSTFQTLATEAEARGIKLILDGVFNHVPSDSKYFDRYNRWDASGNLTSPSGPGTNDSALRPRGHFQRMAEFVLFQASGTKCYDGTPGSLTMTYTRLGRL